MSASLTFFAGAFVAGEVGALRVAYACAMTAAQSVSGALSMLTKGSRAASGETTVARATAAPAFRASGPFCGPTSGFLNVPFAYSGVRRVMMRAPLVRGRIPTVVKDVLTTVTPGEHIDILVTDHGIAVNPKRPKLAERLHEAGIDTVRIEDLYQRAVMLTGRPDAIRFTDRPVAVIRYRDGSVIDAVYQIAADTEG